MVESKSSSGYKLAFHAVFADFPEYLSTHDSDLDLVSDVH